MAAAGCRLHADLTELAVMWFGRALANLHKFLDLAGRADRYFRHHRPDAVVLIDYPGFNWWITWRGKIHGIPVFYYTPPQIWAWATWRAREMRRLTDHVLCSLPFEEAWFRQRAATRRLSATRSSTKCGSTSSMKPFLEHHRRRSGPLVTILPGSRTRRCCTTSPGSSRRPPACDRLCQNARFAIAAFKPKHAEMAQAMTEGERSGHPHRSSGRRSWAGDRDLLRSHAGAYGPGHLLHGLLGLGVDGTALSHQTDGHSLLDWPAGLRCPTAISKVKYITLVNLLSTGELYPADFDSLRPDASGGGEGPVPRVPHVRRQVGRRGRARDRVAAGPGGVGPSNRRPGAIEGPRGPRRGFGPSGGVYFAELQ